MDPQTVAFQPQNELWRYQHELQRLQATQAEHADRLLRIERRQDDEARMKSVWGGTSPFPSILSGTPQQTPLQQANNDVFKHFDDESANLIGSLHLDADDEPRRVGATSRANSVRFDESANHGHWSNPSRSSMDLMRSGAGLPMSERTSSHKSEGRASSVHSNRSLASGRASSLNIDAVYGFGECATPPDETTGIAPGLLILGPVPAVIRCWMNTNFRHDALLYAAVCSGSHRSFIDRRLVEKLHLGDRLVPTTSGVQSVMLPVYLPEAIPHPAASRVGSPAPQIPTVSVNFTVIEAAAVDPTEDKGIQIVLGSDTLRMHNADVLFSTNSLTLVDDERTKVSVPLVRPEDERTFDCLRTTSEVAQNRRGEEMGCVEAEGSSAINGLGQQNKTSSAESVPALGVLKSSMSQKSPVAVPADAASTGAGASDGSDDDGHHLPPIKSIRFAQLPSSAAEANPTKEDEMARPEGSRATPTSAIWSNWRQRGPDMSPGVGGLDYTGTGRSREAGQRRESGIKVLRPARSTSRSASGSAASTIQGQDAKSRFFDEGKRRPSESPLVEQGREWTSSGSEVTVKETIQDRTPTSTSMSTLTSTVPGASGPARVNPAGSASAFSWLKADVVR